MTKRLYPKPNRNVGNEDLLPHLSDTPSLADLATRKAPWVGVPTIYSIVKNHFDEVHAARQNGWEWRTIIKALGIPPEENARVSASYCGLRRMREKREARAIKARKSGDHEDW